MIHRPHGDVAQKVLPAPSFDSCVARHRVHRVALGEVFITDAVRAADDYFVCGAQLPRAHAYFGDSLQRPRQFDPLLLMEVTRQAGLLISHDFYDVPREHKFVLSDIHVELTDGADLRIGESPAELVLDVRVVDRRTRGSRVTALGLTARFILDNRAIATAGVTLAFHQPPIYELVRDRARARLDLPALADTREHRPRYGVERSVDPIRIGRLDPDNVVIGALRSTPEGTSAPLVIDPAHPSMFDHPQDHVPGMVMLEAYRQIAVLAAAQAHALNPVRAVLHRCRTRYAQFGELELATTATVLEMTEPARVGDTMSTSLRLQLSQEGASISSAELELRFPVNRDQST